MAARLRRALGYDDLVSRVETLEAHLAGLEGPRFPRGPVYLGDHTALVAARWGAKLVVDTRDSLLAPWLLLDGLWESHVTGWMQASLHPGDHFVDVGANIGYFTLLGAQTVGPQGRVVAVEAHPQLVQLLRRNVVINGMHDRVEVCHRAAWSEETTLRFHQRVRYSANSSLAPTGDAALAELADTQETVEVPAATLDQILDDMTKVDLIKMDVEGAEVHAVSGLERTLRRNPNVTVMFEWSPAQIRQMGDDPADLIDAFSTHGFRFRLMEDDLAPVDRDGLLEVTYGNVVARRS